MTDDATIRQRIHGREQAILCLEMIEADSMPAAALEAFSAEIEKRCAPPRPTPRPGPPPMNDSESAAFGQVALPYGKHQGTKVDDVPLAYLEWMANPEDSDLVRSLRRYLASDRVRRERAGEEPEAAE